jgi:hypothetical protein
MPYPVASMPIVAIPKKPALLFRDQRESAAFSLPFAFDQTTVMIFRIRGTVMDQ